MQRADSLEKTLMLGKIKGKRRKGWQRMRQFNSITDPMDMNLNKLQETVKDEETCCAACPRGHKESDTTKRLNNRSPSLTHFFNHKTFQHAYSAESTKT